MDFRLTHLRGSDLLACAVLGTAELRRRVGHELDRRAVRALVRRILAEEPAPARKEAGAGAPVAA